MQPDRASAVTAAMIGNRNARATRTGAFPHSETAPVLHRLWLTNRFYEAESLEPFPFRWNQNGALASCFDAFSLREPVSTSLENALRISPANNRSAACAAGTAASAKFPRSPARQKPAGPG